MELLGKAPEVGGRDDGEVDKAEIAEVGQVATTQCSATSVLDKEWRWMTSSVATIAWANAVRWSPHTDSRARSRLPMGKCTVNAPAQCEPPWMSLTPARVPSTAAIELELHVLNAARCSVVDAALRSCCASCPAWKASEKPSNRLLLRRSTTAS